MRELTPGATFRSRYLIKQQIGRGGMGVVFEAIDLQRGGLPCALKMLRDHREVNQHYQRRFAEEFKLLTRLKHPHIVEVFDAVSTEEDGQTPADRLYIVMERLRGETLGDWLKSDQVMTLAQAIRFVTQALSGLDSAHQAGVIHRDLKPDNLFITRDERGEQTLKILDFGVAKDLTSDISLTESLDNAMIGTPHYMAPEQVKNERVTPQSDLYAIGVILYQLILGYPVFAQERFEMPAELKPLPKSFQLTWLQIHAEPPPLNFEPQLDQMIMRLLNKESHNRYYEARSLRLALQEWLRSHPKWGGTLIPLSRSAPEEVREERSKPTLLPISSLTSVPDLSGDQIVLHYGDPDDLFATIPPQSKPRREGRLTPPQADLILKSPTDQSSSEPQLDGTTLTEAHSATQAKMAELEVSLESGLESTSQTSGAYRSPQTRTSLAHSKTRTQKTIVSLLIALSLGFTLIFFVPKLVEVELAELPAPQELTLSTSRPQVNQSLPQTILSLKRALESAAGSILIEPDLFISLERSSALQSDFIDLNLSEVQRRELEALLKSHPLGQLDPQPASSVSSQSTTAYLTRAFALTWLQKPEQAREALLLLNHVDLAHLQRSSDYHLYGLILTRLTLPKSEMSRQALGMKAFKLADRSLLTHQEISSIALAELDVRLVEYLRAGDGSYVAKLLTDLQQQRALRLERTLLLTALTSAE